MIKTPISYYGGKQRLASTIIPLIPEHILYAEPFVGGAAIYFAKDASEVEVINDLNTEIINFFRVMKDDFVNLSKEVKVTLHSRRLHSDASVVYNNPHLFSAMKRAWAVWVLAIQSFASQLDGSFGFDKSRNTMSKKIKNKVFEFDESFAIRLQNTQIECADAIYIIQSRDTQDSFFYCDPPYFNSDCGHYAGYSEYDFGKLLQVLSGIKGKFLLSSYPSDILDKYIKQHGWYQKTVEQYVSVNKGSGKKKKIECLTANYPIE
jgi:DNA adenine methylase